MELAMIGLGKMGFNMSHRLLRGGHQVVGFAHDPKAIQALEQLKGVGAGTLQEAVNKLKPPRIIWLMIPAVNTIETVEDLVRILSRGDIVIDGGNSYYKDSIKHAEMLAAKGIEFVDCGTSGGVWGWRKAIA